MTDRERLILQEAKAAILSVEPRAEVILFGSRARGEAHEESDFDLMVITPEEVRVLERGPYYAEIGEVNLRHLELLSMFFVSKGRWEEEKADHPFLKQVLNDGIPI